MNKKISKIFGLALTVTILASMLVASLPASAATLAWTSEKDPTDEVENVIVPTTNMIDIAANGDVVYAATDNSTLPLYKSTDGGATWASLATTTAFPTGVSVKAVAVAADDANTVVFVSSADKVYYSSNGGSSWTNLDVPTDTNPAQTASSIDCIDVSTGTTKYIAVGGDNGTNAVLFTIRLAMAETWQERYHKTVADGGGYANGANASATTIKAIKFSPNFATEKAIVMVSGYTNEAQLQIFRYEAGDYDFNGSISYMSADWGTGIALDEGTSTDIVGTLAAADLALPSSFMANDEGDRLVYAATAGSTSGGGVLRVTDTVDKGFQTWSGGDEGGMCSIAYNEAGKLVAGSYTDNLVYQFMSPTDSVPKATRTNSLKQPGGQNKTSVVYSGDNVLAGTQGNNSCVSLSTDDGYSFNDIGLIDTAFTTLSDFAVSADGSKIYLVTNDGTDTSVWLKASAWKRVLVLEGELGIIIRLAPEDASVAYLADTAGTTSTSVWVTKNSGTETWKAVPCYKVTGVKDMAVVSADVVYVLDTAAGAGVSKTTNAGASWGTTAKATDTVTSNMIVVASNGDVLVGGANGYVAYSKDGGSTYSRTKSFGTGNIYVIPDDDYATNNIIYGATTTTVYRSKATTTDTPAARSSMPTALTAHTIKGMAQVQEVTYVLSANTTGSALHKCLTLETAGSATLAEWTYITTTADYTSTPQALKLSQSGTTPKLWAIDTTDKDLDSVTDPIALAGPTLKSPAAATSVAVNAGTGRSYDITFIMERYDSSAIDEVELQIATDSAFNAVIYDYTFTNITTNTIAKVIGPTGQTNQVAEFMPGETYYWRTRTGATGPWYSPWSESRSFTVESPDTFAISGPALGSSDASVTPTFTWAEYPDAIGYEIMLSEDPTFAIIDWSYNVANNFYALDEALKYSTTYYWRVRGVTGASTLVGSTWVTPAGPWITGVFTTKAEPTEAAETTPVVITTPGETEIKIVEVPVQTSPVIPTYILWVIVGIGAILLIALIVLIVRTRRVA